MLCSYRNSLISFSLTRFFQLTAALVTFCILAADSTLLLAQHDGARDSVQQIALGKFEKVDQILEKKKPFAGEAESAFVKLLQSAAQDDVAKATEYGKQAVELGIPPERLVVGPRTLLGRLPENSELNRWVSEQVSTKLVHGPMVGSVTDHSASIWLRTLGDAKVDVTCIETGQKLSSMTSKKSDWTTVLTFDNLPSAAECHYVVHIDGKQCATSSFRTYPIHGTGGQFSVGFGGGAGFVPEWERMWDTILDYKPHAFLMMGDNVYIDQPQQSLTQRYCYYRRQSRPEWQRFTSQTSMYSIWDDHDFGTNDCIPGPEIEVPTWKRSVWEIYKQNWVNPSYGGGSEQPGCWYDFHIGDVHFLMLDGRYYRDLKGGSMLGPVQKTWLLKTLKESSATFKVIASPVPFTVGIKKGSRDPWDGFPEERAEIFDWIQTQRIEGVFLVAADRHRTDLRVNPRPDAYDLYEFESSRLTNHHTHSVVQTDGLIWGYNETCSFALMTFDTDQTDPIVKFQCIDIDGKVHHTFVLKHSQLKFK
ncbi:MAG: alkaline phosphatase D family protein [Rubripirellula sp.]